ncbi:hypothetical protein E2562_026071 [Oryza meyeriana var. granulata]|uniref:Uncharacterized protein n=1 Tax=Oryza meyeriana var. granulata TaxID=110450 RepID=A0A6G1E498_9ORYZ|nr:hypothetical protein E2562_026071 [Oryza meyeriana var. granulata]
MAWIRSWSSNDWDQSRGLTPSPHIFPERRGSSGACRSEIGADRCELARAPMASARQAGEGGEDRRRRSGTGQRGWATVKTAMADSDGAR